MKSQTLPTKRRPASSGVLRKLSAVTQRRRKQRVATAATSRDFDDEGNSKIARALIIILLIHLVAVAMIFVHHQFLDGRPTEQVTLNSGVAAKAEPAPASKPVEHGQIVSIRVSSEDKPYLVGQGENYASIAKLHQVAEQDLRELNGNVELRRGAILKIPVKRVVVKPPAPVDPVVAEPVQAVPARDRGLVEAIDTRHAPRARPIASADAANGYLVQKGDTFWGIATKHGVDVNKLMEFNGISDPRKLRVGMSLRIP